MDKKNQTLLTVAIAIVIITVLAAMFMGSNGEKQQDQRQTAQKTAITVSGSAVLTEAFTDMEKEFEADNSGIDLIMNFGNAGSLRMQIEGGAPIDVFAPGDVNQMDMLASKGLVYNDSRKEFAGSSLVIIVPKGNVLNITDMKDLARPEVKKIALSDTEASTVGRYAKQSLIEEGLWNSVQDKLLTGDTVKNSLFYVERGEADAGFVFMTDVSSAQPGTIEVASSVPVSTPIIYPIAVVSATQHPKESQLFIDFVTGEKGKSILGQYGFLIPQTG
ncbi:molybdenum ABC transporter, periplasmic molybdate-binding protein [Methanomethylovorans hollandica DSM 15978]|uniref:Molybdenum ABC transporter, periplasmic molybdate-binding protein n=1 Tax=Methanomethylovorans hollandica (strain DSM 15978 / NBRC 107637 / DMS1) TaxID=867904 RepID=L0L230_METHD|nr:molybdate ABC transporter substrate-binding protein [Methanomethylovorans hollandica]AGB50473.1 molybdenum ABC transporter, periplasmic molybdate-binding protein [Methanomethylovorans hollandica DSM 15978]